MIQSSTRTKLMAGVVVFQLMVLLAEYLNSVYPHWVGERVVMRVEPVDPRSLFRGNYAILRYDITDLKLAPEQLDPPLREGEVVYLPLEQQGELHLGVVSGLGRSCAEEVLCIRGRVLSAYDDEVSIHYGIDAFFAPKERALELEAAIRSQGDELEVLAEIQVAPNGKASLAEVRIAEK